MPLKTEGCESETTTERLQDGQKGRQRGRSKRSDEAYYLSYGEPLSAARTKLTGFFNILPGD